MRNELPRTLKAYRYQQPRRSCGPANLFRKMTKEIIFCSTQEGVNLQENSCHLCFLLCEEDNSTPGHFLLLLRGHTCKCHGSRNKTHKAYSYSKRSLHSKLQSLQWSRSLHLLVFWILFENVMSLRRTKAAIIGLLEANRVNEWVVTEKLGNTVRQKNTFKASKKVRSCIGYRSFLHNGIWYVGTFITN